jgi:hypothetical protein
LPCRELVREGPCSYRDRGRISLRREPWRSSSLAAQLQHPTNRLGARPFLLRLDRHAQVAYRWSCAAQRVTPLSSCALRSLCGQASSSKPLARQEAPRPRRSACDTSRISHVGCPSAPEPGLERDSRRHVQSSP